MSTRRTAFYAAAGTLILLCCAMTGIDWGGTKTAERIVGFALLVPAGVAVTLLWPREISRRTQIAGLLLLALATRLVLLPHRADSDINRYLWEGRLIRAGESPYAHVAADPAWAPFRDEYWAGMNQKSLRTIYPPVAQWVFAATGGASYHAAALKVVFIAFDLGVVALILALLAQRGLPLRFAGFYAFNPVPLLGFAGEGHFDPMMLFFALLALWLHESRKPAWSWLALGIAVQMKPVAVLLAPLLLRRGGWRSAWIGAAAAALPFLPYHSNVPAWFEGVRHFGGDFAFNGSVHALLWRWLGGLHAASVTCGWLLATWVAGAALTQRDSIRAAFWIFGGLVVLAPTVHYWYLAWALVFIPVFPSLSWLTVSGTIGLYFLVRSGGLPQWAQLTIWSPFGALLLRETWAALAPHVDGRSMVNGTPARTLAVIVPALNEEKVICRCLESVARMNPSPDELMVVDGGSTDLTRELASRFDTFVAVSAPGRGLQIAAGVGAARSDAVLVLHADSTVAPDAGRRVLAALNANPAVIGGAIGQQFNRESLKLIAIEVLNEVRALFLGISFGDQGQFFRRATVMERGGFPALPLMEDVEFSLRARTSGRTVYLGGGIVSSDRGWRNECWLKRVAVVVSMTALYRLKRRAAAGCSAELYRRYYGRPATRADRNVLRQRQAHDQR